MESTEDAELILGFVYLGINEISVK
jgi:hypothetical protein